MAMTKPTSEQVTFLQTGTGATTRTVDAKLKDTVSVKDFGAVGDGVTDDTAAFNAAITAAGTRNVYVPGSSYAITGTVTGSFYSDGVVTIVGGTVKTVSTTGTNKIQSITASVAASALTITLNPTILDFRSSPLTSGTVTSLVVAAAISLTIPSTSTMGTTSAVQSRIVVLAINNAGTVELAAVNIAGGSVLDETTLITTIAAVAAGNSATAYYSTTARSSVAYRVVGYVESTQATAGTWATAPSTIQGMGGQALTAMGSIGYGQTWQDLTASRVLLTNYYNTTSKPIFLSIQIGAFGNTADALLLLNGVIISRQFGGIVGGSFSFTIQGIVPVGQYYNAQSAQAIVKWSELR